MLLRDAPHGRSAHAGSKGHVVLMVDQFPAVLGGGERALLRMAMLLRGAGWRVSIVTFQVLCAPELLQNSEVYVLPISSVTSVAALRSAWVLGRFLRRERVDVVMTFFESSNLFGGLATRLLSRAKLIWNRRDMGILREPKHVAAYPRLRWMPHHVIAVSDEVRRHAIEVDGIPAVRVSVVYNGVDASGSLRSTATESVVLTVGNLRPVKGQDVLLEAAAEVLRQRPEVRFQLAGEALDESYAAKLRQQAVTLGIADRVEFLGGVADPRRALQQASIFVLPSRSEGFSNAIVEAMLAGLPVVATTVGGNGEAVVDGETGLLVPPEDAHALAAALLQLVKHPEQGRAMGEAGRARAETLFTAQGMLRRLEEIFAGL